MEKEVRNHFSIVLLNTLKYTWFFLAMAIFDFLPDADDVSAEEGELFASLGIAALLLLISIIVFIFELIRWRKTYIFIKDGQLIIDKRFKIMKNKTTVKISGISSVNLKQNILQRVLNVYSIQLDINSAVTADKTDFHLVFGQNEAAEFQRLITDLKQEIEFKAPSTENTAHPPQPVYVPVVSFPLRRVIRHSLLSLPLTQIIVYLGILAAIFLPSFFAEEAEPATGIDWQILNIIAIVIIAAQSIIPFFRYYGFTVVKQPKKAVISYGLLTKQQYTLPLDKTSALIIRQSLFSRMAHLYYAELINIGMADEETKESPMLCLLVNKQELDTIIEQVTPSFVFSEPIHSSPPPALLSVLIKYTLLGLPVFAAGLILGYWWAGFLWLVLILLAGFLSFKTKGLGLGLHGDNIAITSGIFSKKTLITTYSKIQDISTKDGPISRKFGLCKASITILAGSLNKTHLTGYFPSDKFDYICQSMVKHQSIEGLNT
ncbi:MAG: PH domain-containing protein [Oscillospiraceae bacterium]|nr:PH domain-containing protein [Oscillospiraceae bacterium]MDD4413976.1 PH domain-containing protein [Oscillospiraceae bacterium]